MIRKAWVAAIVVIAAMRGVSLAEGQEAPRDGFNGEAPPPVLVVEQTELPPGEVVVNEVAVQTPPVLVTPSPPPQRVLGDLAVENPDASPYALARYGWTASFLTVPISTTHDIHMSGGSIAVRVRAPMYAIDLSLGILRGDDQFLQARTEVPISFDYLWFINRYEAFQVFVRLGLGMTFASVEAPDDGARRLVDLGTRDFTYFSVAPGAGFEWRPVPTFGLSAEVRPSFRIRTDRTPSAGEYVEVDAEGRETGRSTNPVFMTTIAFAATLYFSS